MVARVPPSASAPFGASREGFGVPPLTARPLVGVEASTEESGSRPSAARLFAGTAGYAVLALTAFVMLLVGRPQGYFASILFSFVHALGIGLAAIGWMGLRSPAASLAAATTAVSGLAMLSIPLVHVLDVESTTMQGVFVLVLHATLTLSAVTTAAAAIASRARVGTIRMAVAALWSLGAIPAARFVYASGLVLLRDPLNPADDPLWSSLYFGLTGIASAVTAVAFVVVKTRSDAEAA